MPRPTRFLTSAAIAWAALSCGPGARAPATSPRPMSACDTPEGAVGCEPTVSQTIHVDALEVEVFGVARREQGGSWQARLTNTAAETVRAILDLRAMPGMWAGPNWQQQFVVELPPGTTLDVAPWFVLRALTSASALRVRLYVAQGTDSLITSTPRWEQRYEFGAEPAAQRFLATFDSAGVDGITVYAGRSTMSRGELHRNAVERSAAAARIAEMLRVAPPAHVRIVFYPDEVRKLADTGHRGVGFAFGTTIVEVRNDSVQLNPYHELAHIIAAQIGDPPALFNEGFATYVSEHLGTPALPDFGWGVRTIDDVVCELARTERLIDVDRLFDFTEIGSEASNSTVAYPQSAAIVEFLIRRYGIDKFLAAYRELTATEDVDERHRNRAAVARIYARSTVELGQAWHTDLVCGGPS